MTPRERTPDDRREGPGDAPRGPCAPIRETAAAELDGLYRFAIARLGGREHMARDVVQEALSIALRHAHPPEDACEQRAWLRGIVRNVMKHEARSRRRRRAAMERASGEPDRGRASDAASQVCEAEEARRSAVQALFLAVTDLDAADQDLFYAFYGCGRSHASIAEELGTTVKAVEARLYRLRSRLRARGTPGVSTT